MTAPLSPRGRRLSLAPQPRSRHARRRWRDHRLWIGSSTEIHEQKEKEEELRRANDDLQQFAYSASHDLQEPIRNVAVYSEIVAKRYHRRLGR